MHTTRLALALSAALPLALLAAARPRPPLQAPGDVEHAALAPARALAYVEFEDADGLLARGLGHPLLRTLLGGEVGEALAAQAGRTPEQALAGLDERAGYAVLPALRELTARGAALSIELRRARPSVLLTLRGEDAATVEARLAQALERAAELAGFPGALAAPAETRGDTALWRIGDDLVIAHSGAWVLVSSDEAAVTAALERARGAEGLAGTEDFASARAARPDGATLWGWVDLERARALQRLGDGDRGLLELAEAAAQPPVQFLVGPTLALIGSARHASLALRVRGEDVELAAEGFGVAAGAARELLPRGGALAAGLEPDDVLHGAVYRDLRGLFSARGELFGPRAQPGFAEAESNLALFFGGRDVAEHVLPHLSPWVEVVAREVDFRDDARPDAALPAAALLVRVDDPATTGADLVAAFQTAISIVNVDRAQKAMPSMRLELAPLADTTITSARFAPPAPGTGVDLRYNLEPACALVGDTFVVGTHRALVAELVGERRGAPAPGAAAGTAEHLRLSGAALAELARAQRELLVMGRVLNEGRTREVAEREVDLGLGLLERLEGLELATERRGEDTLAASLRLDLRGRGTAK